MQPDALKHAPRALMAIGGALFVLSVLVGLAVDGRPGVLYIVGGVGLLLAGFGLTIHLFTEGVAGRRTGA